MSRFDIPSFIRRPDGKVDDNVFRRSPELSEAYKGVWERVSGMALEIISKDRGAEGAERANDILQNPSFKEEMMNRWIEQSLKKNGVVDDPKIQDGLWAKGLALKVKDMIDN